MTRVPGRIKFVAWFAALLGIAAVIFAIAVVGSPQTVRSRKLDSDRCNDLVAIREAVVSYYAKNKRLPDKISQLEFEKFQVGRGDQPLDPRSKQPYGYDRTGDKTYRLSAEFGADSMISDDEAERRWDYPFIKHVKGRNVFDLDVKDEPS